MQSRNPILNSSPAFNRQSAQQYGHETYAAGGRGYQGYGQVPPRPASTDPATWTYPSGPTVAEPMTMDSVVARTAVTLGLVVLSGALTWVFVPNDAARVAWVPAMLVGAGLGIWLSFMRSVKPAVVVLYSILQGVFLGAASEAFESIYSGIVVQAILGTVAAFVATLAAYKFFNIQVTDRMRRFGLIFGLGFFVVTFFDFILYQFGADIGFNDFGTLGLITSFVGLGLGVFYLILDFDLVEQGVRAGVPEQESWRAAFALTATLIFIYIELLRILAILRGDS
jgi:uncharacterized YccA/Bax inhibitor family protein